MNTQVNTQISKLLFHRSTAILGILILMMSIPSCSILKINSQKDFEKLSKLKKVPHKKVLFQSGVYKLKNGIFNLHSNTNYSFEDSTFFILKNDAKIISKFKKNISIEGLNVIVEKDSKGKGTGAVQFISCNNVKIENMSIKFGNASGLVLDKCSNFEISNSEITGNYYYGAYDRKGNNNRYTSCIFNNNGGIDGANPYKGRGMVIWEGHNIKVISSSFQNNNEYGLRIYSQKKDRIESRFIKIEKCFFKDNGSKNNFVKDAIDLYLYGGTRKINSIEILNNIFVRTVGYGKSVNIMGDNITVLNNTFKGNANSTGIFVYTGANIKIKNNEFSRLKTAVQNGSKNIKNCTIESNNLIKCSTEPFKGNKLLVKRNRIIE